MKAIIQYNYLLVVLISIILNSCEFIEIAPPKDRITTELLFKDETTATASVLGIYGRLGSTTPPFSNGGTTIYTGLSSDELVYTGTVANQTQFFENSISPDNSIVNNNFWRQTYQIIYHATACIEGLEQSALSTIVKNQLLGESHFIRAFGYFYLVNLFGDVPIAKTTDYEKNARLSRSPAIEVYNYILSDLLRAKELLTPNYPTNGKLRVNYYTVLALLSRFYLYTENWQATEEISSDIISSGLYKIEPDLEQVFLAQSQEAIWQLSTDQPLFNTIEGNRFIPGAAATARPNYALSPSLISTFEQEDLRFSNWVGRKTVQNINYYYPYKYKISINTVKTEHYVMFRLAEIYLNRAEARVNINRNNDAVSDINILRERANLSNLALDNTIDILKAIYQERRIEYFAEYGHRWFDLKRSNQINDVLNKVKQNWKETDALFPIPSEEIIVNNNLVQNPGYNN